MQHSDVTIAELTLDQAKAALRNACWLGAQHIIVRYLLANQIGRINGADKAFRHRDLCDFYAAVLTGEAIEFVAWKELEVHQAIHRKTQLALTDRLDETIGFDPGGRSDLEQDARRFFEVFHRVAFEVAAEYPDRCTFRESR